MVLGNLETRGGLPRCVRGEHGAIAEMYKERGSDPDNWMYPLLSLALILSLDCWVILYSGFAG